MEILDRVYLRDMGCSHLNLILKWRNQEDIRKFMFYDKVITFEEHKNWFLKVQESKDPIIKVFIYRRKTDRDYKYK